MSPFTEISFLFQEGIIKKISYERRAYKSVDEKNLSYRLCPEERRKKLVHKGLTVIISFIIFIFVRSPLL